MIALLTNWRREIHLFSDSYAWQRRVFALVISPLIALMQDQVERLSKKGIKAASIASGANSSRGNDHLV